MNLEEKINNEIKAAMMVKDTARLAALRAIKSEILLLKSSEKGSSEDAENKAMMKMVKQRKETAEIYKSQNRPELEEIEFFQAKVIEGFLPAQMSAEEIETAIKQIITSVGAASMADMGKVMGVATKQLAGKAEGKTISELVRKLLAVLLVTFCFSFLSAQNINTFGGNGTAGWSGDGGPATSAEIQDPSGVATDNSGNLYFADQGNYLVRKIDASGTMTRIAGLGVFGFTGDGGPATSAEIADAQGIFVDSKGNIYFDDFANNRVRKINTAGIIHTIAGIATSGFGGDGGPATMAELNAPSGVVVDSNGNVYIADEANDRIRMVDTGRIIHTFAGNGVASYSGDGGIATSAEINNITGVGIDKAQNIYIADLGNQRIRMVNTSGIISTVAGNGVSGFSGDGGPATLAELSGPTGVWMDGGGNMYIGDQSRIRMVNPSGTITTVGGNGTSGYSGDGGPATSAEFNYAFAVTTDVTGNIYFGDVFNARVRKIDAIPTGIAESRNVNRNIIVYPNPNNGKFTIELSVVRCQSLVEIYNVVGEMIYSAIIPQTPKGALKEIDLSNQSKGIYFYKVVSETGEIIGSGKIVSGI